MNNRAAEFDRDAASLGQSNAVTVTDTESGYIVRPGTTVLIRAAYGEMAASFTAVLLGMAAYGLWLLPTANDTEALLPFRLGGTVVFFVMAGMLYLIARRGLCCEVQIDLTRRVLRTARRNRHGRATPIRDIAIADVESVFLKRDKSGFLRSKLCVRIAGDRGLTEVAGGLEAELAPLLQRMTKDLRKEISEVRQPQRTMPTSSRVRSAFAAR